jgi:non-canonical purine NTP pyrophosphatase (RdgB/HAM1 family)
MEITFITGHAKKAEQLSWHLDYPVSHQKLDLPEIQSLDPVEVVTHKALEAYRAVGKPVLVEDISISFRALGKLPGTLIKWFLQELNPEGLCRLLDGYETRDAVVSPCFALCTDGKDVKIFSAEMPGVISEKPRGENGFGADSVFVPNGYSKTWGEMNDEEQIETSVRKIALKKLKEYLELAKN